MAEASFGRWLSARRHLLDLTQDELARRVGCSVVTIRKLEADERRPSKQIAARLAACLEVAQAEQPAFLKFARADLPTETTPLASLGVPIAFGPTPRPRTNLTAPLTPLIGRAQDIAATRNRLVQVQERLVTLIGPPGIGKTRLAIAVASEVQDAFSDEVYFVALAPISDSELVIPTIARTLGVTEVGTESVLETLKRALAEKRILLVLDNFEQVVPAATALAELLMDCHGLKVLVTSRVALRVRGERLYPVPPLLLPDLAHLPPLAKLAGIPTVALFLERAQAVRPDFALSEANAAVIAEICVRLDGLPLAIELAAARIRLFSPDVLLSRLSNPLKVLTGGARDLPARQQTLRATIDWSYQLLDPGEQMLLVQLGVFVGGCTLEAAEAICVLSGDLAIDVVDGIMSLLDKSLLRQEAGAGGAPRFTLLELIREYALERLDTSGEAERVRQRHAAYYLALAKRAEPKLRGAEQVAWMDRMEQEIGNLRAALDWYHAQPDGLEQELWLLGSLWTFWIIHCHFTEASARYAAALARPGDTAALAPARALALLGAGFLAHLSGRATGVTFGEQSLALYQQLGDQWGIALALNLLGQCAAHHQNDPARAAALLEESLTLSRLISDPWCLGLAYSNLIGVYMWRENYDRAKPLLEEHLMFSQELRQPYFMAEAYYLLGDVWCHEGEYAKADSCYQQSMLLFRELGDKRYIADVLHSQGYMATAQHEYRSAASFYEQSLTLFRQLGHIPGMSAGLAGLGVLALRQSEYAQARAYLEESISLLRESGQTTNVAWSLVHLGYVALRQGDHARAHALFVEGQSRFKETGHKGGLVYTLEGLASLAVAQGQPERAARLFAWADAMRETIGDKRPPVRQADVDRDLTRIRTQLDEAAIAVACAAGRAMTIEQAIAGALEQSKA